MTARRITAHKGGRTARAPEARIRPQTLGNIEAEKQERDVSFGDMLEEIWGDDEMTDLKRPIINWKELTAQNLYLLQYYGKTAAIRKRAKAELLKREK